MPTRKVHDFKILYPVYVAQEIKEFVLAENIPENSLGKLQEVGYSIRRSLFKQGYDLEKTDLYLNLSSDPEDPGWELIEIHVDLYKDISAVEMQNIWRMLDQIIEKELPKNVLDKTFLNIDIRV